MTLERRFTLEGEPPFDKSESLSIDAPTFLSKKFESHSPFEKGDLPFKKGEWKGE
jgi:hypothetical protein